MQRFISNSFVLVAYEPTKQKKNMDSSSRHTSRRIAALISAAGLVNYSWEKIVMHVDVARTLCKLVRARWDVCCISPVAHARQKVGKSCALS